jgi:hypothetical protein
MEWINVKNRLPEEGVHVLSYAEFEQEIRIDYIIYVPEPVWARRLDREQTNITHWMPLPNPPNMSEKTT